MLPPDPTDAARLRRERFADFFVPFRGRPDIVIDITVAKTVRPPRGRQLFSTVHYLQREENWRMARARFCGVGALAAEAAKQTGLGNFPSGGFIKNFLARAACKRTVPWPLMEYLLPVAFAPKTALGRLWPPTGELREAYGGAGFTARLRRICLVLSNCAGSFFRRSR